METVVQLRIIDSVRWVQPGGDEIAFESAPAAFRPRLSLRQVTPELVPLLQRLREPEGVSEGWLVASALTAGGTTGLGKLRHYLARLNMLGMLDRLLLADGRLLLTLHPVSPYFQYASQEVGEVPFVLSRFALSRSDRGLGIVESPRSHARVEIHDAAAQGALFALLRPRTARELAEDVPGLDENAAPALLDLLASAQIALPSPDRRPVPEDDDPVLVQWAFHDMLFHGRHRLGRHADPYGGTFPFRGRLEAPPVVKPAIAAPAVPLPRPDLEALQREDLPFTRVLESRASLRAHSEEPLRLAQLAEFLFRTARIKKKNDRDGVSFRPSPSGGALHALEVYPLVGRCQGLESGLYHYDPEEHVLRRVAEMNPAVAKLLELGGITAMMEGLPQVLLIVTARFQRVQNKYQSVAYSVILKDVGCLYQTMYLVATAMGLAPCALGGGHSDLFAQASGLPYFEESSVGEFVLGRPGTPAEVEKERWQFGAGPPPCEGGGS